MSSTAKSGLGRGGRGDEGCAAASARDELRMNLQLRMQHKQQIGGVSRSQEGEWGGAGAAGGLHKQHAHLQNPATHAAQEPHPPQQQPTPPRPPPHPHKRVILSAPSRTEALAQGLEESRAEAGSGRGGKIAESAAARRPQVEEGPSTPPTPATPPTHSHPPPTPAAPAFKVPAPKAPQQQCDMQRTKQTLAAGPLASSRSGTQFPCLTSRKVQIVTQMLTNARSRTSCLLEIRTCVWGQV